jgi:diacylglycerol kinase family enzyme
LAGIGVICNPRSGRNQGDARAAHRLAHALGDHGVVREARSLDELYRVAEDFRKLDVDILGISGGDGTNSVTITGFLDVYASSALPQIGLLRGGTANTVANSIGVRQGRPEDLLEQLLRAYLARASRPLLEIERHVICLRGENNRRSVSDQPGMPRFALKYGFLFGTGVVYGYLAEYYAGGSSSSVVAAKTLLRAIGSTIVRGPMIRRMAEPFRGSVELDDGTLWQERDYLAVAGGTIDQIGLNFRPFYRSGERPGTFHVLGIYTSPLGFVSQLGRVWSARPMRPGHTHEALAKRVIVRSSKSPLKYMIDGDLHECDGPLDVSIGPVVRIVVGNSRR